MIIDQLPIDIDAEHLYQVGLTDGTKLKGFFNFSDNYNPDDDNSVAFISENVSLTNKDFDEKVITLEEIGEKRK